MKKLTTAVAILVSVFLCASSAFALETYVNFDRWAEPDGKERNLDDILESLYGWGNLERVDDAIDDHWILSDTDPDGIDGGATAQAKYAGFGETVGYWAGGSFEDMFFIKAGNSKDFDNGIDYNPYGYDVNLLAGTIDADIVGAGPFELGLKPSNTDHGPWSSDASQNYDGLDHMVTFRIVGNDGFSDNAIGNYVVAWEDYNDLGDFDYNDVVVELSGVRPTPEPGTVILMGLGLLGLGVLQRRRKK